MTRLAPRDSPRMRAAIAWISLASVSGRSALVSLTRNASAWADSSCVFCGCWVRSSSVNRICTAVFRLSDQVSTAPRGVCDQSCDRISIAISLSPANKFWGAASSTVSITNPTSLKNTERKAFCCPLERRLKRIDPVPQPPSEFALMPKVRVESVDSPND